ncbi:AMP-binding protein [Maricurvus nonylphenolicus]|uniref:AMP-binding protein n=1 Tax=Maricurvus nonylphenolicus TaxID=1008307 RepID=UPI0036F3FD42
MNNNTLIDYLDHWAENAGHKPWLRDLTATGSKDYSWSEGRAEINAVAAALEKRFGHGINMLLLSRNCAHWVLADMAIIRSGNVTCPIFTTQAAETVEYLAAFVEAKVIFVGESTNWQAIKRVLPADITIVTLPGTELPDDVIGAESQCLKWETLLAEGQGKKPVYNNQPDDAISLVFTSGTTGMPKGVIQTHNSNLIPIRRAELESPDSEKQNEQIRYLSYLPLSHIAERQIIEFQSLFRGAAVSFNQSLETLLSDLQRTQPHIFFAVPRVWQQFQQAIVEKYGGFEAFERKLTEDQDGFGKQVLTEFGFGEAFYSASGSAPLSASLIEWWEALGLEIMEGFGQTEAMNLIISRDGCRRVGSIGKPLDGVEYKITEAGELVVRTDGLTPGYYKQPEKTAELFQDGWLHTGDKARVDEDGFVFITGRVKDYFKTIHGKFVAPPPIEGQFASNEHVEQQCLIGRGFSKTVMVAVLTQAASNEPKQNVETSIQETVTAINNTIEKHARIGAVIITLEPWTIDSGVLTPTLKIRREKIDERFAELGERLALESAEKGQLLLHWIGEYE